MSNPEDQFRARLERSQFETPKFEPVVNPIPKRQLDATEAVHQATQEVNDRLDQVESHLADLNERETKRDASSWWVKPLNIAILVVAVLTLLATLAGIWVTIVK